MQRTIDLIEITKHHVTQIRILFYSGPSRNNVLKFKRIIFYFRSQKHCR